MRSHESLAVLALCLAIVGCPSSEHDEDASDAGEDDEDSEAQSADAGPKALRTYARPPAFDAPCMRAADSVAKPNAGEHERLVQTLPGRWLLCDATTPATYDTRVPDHAGFELREDFHLTFLGQRAGTLTQGAGFAWEHDAHLIEDEMIGIYALWYDPYGWPIELSEDGDTLVLAAGDVRYRYVRSDLPITPADIPFASGERAGRGGCGVEAEVRELFDAGRLRQKLLGSWLVCNGALLHAGADAVDFADDGTYQLREAATGNVRAMGRFQVFAELDALGYPSVWALTLTDDDPASESISYVNPRLAEQPIKLELTNDGAQRVYLVGAP